MLSDASTASYLQLNYERLFFTVGCFQICFFIAQHALSTALLCCKYYFLSYVSKSPMLFAHSVELK
jgi:hypothetical protein